METGISAGIGELQGLGFTQLEAEIYVQLLRTSASTGYAIAQAISKPTANVYKALNSLEKKGAILIDEGKTRLCTPVPVDELLNALQNTFTNQKERVSHFLSQIGGVDEDDKVYRLNQAEQVFEKCRTLLGTAEKTVLLDAFTAAIKPLEPELQKAMGRGVQIALHAYGPVDIPGIRIFEHPQAGIITKKWSGQWLNMIIDSKNFVMAYLSQDLTQVYQAVWSNSLYMSWIYRSALTAEQQLSELKNCLRSANDVITLRDLVADMDQYFDVDVPGYPELLGKYHSNSEV